MTIRASLSSIVAASFIAILSVFAVAHASETNGTILTGSQYAWGENMGWINFAPTTNGAYEGLTVTDTAVTGYAWSTQFGWINFSPTNSGQGVTNTSNGQLGGSAWVASLGWLSMDGVTIGSDGVFTGTAGVQGSNVGRVSFDCANCHVATDWRPASARTQPQTPPAHGGGSSQNVPPPPVTPPVIPPAPVVTPTTTPSSLTPSVPPSGTHPQPISFSGQPVTISPSTGGSVNIISSDGKKVTITIPPGTFSDPVVITITPEELSPTTSPAANISAFLIDGALFDIVAKDQHGNLVHNLGRTVSITIELPDDIKNTTDLGAYYLDESNPASFHWVRIPGAVIAGGTCTIQVNHLTRFGIFKVTGSPDTLPVKALVQTHPSYFIIILLLLLLYGVFVTRWENHRA